MADRRKDLETLERWIAEMEPGDMPYSLHYTQTKQDIVARHLAWLVRCGRFVEDHGDLVETIVRNEFSHHDDCYTLERAAAESLASLRSAGGKGSE